MIWIEQLGRYFVFEDEPVAEGDIRKPYFNASDPLDIVRDTSAQVTPPAGLFAPQSGFGLVWRGDVSQSPGFRDRLGWALAPEFGYAAIYQCDDATPSGGRVWQTCYLKGSDDRIMALLSIGAWHWLDETSSGTP